MKFSATIVIMITLAVAGAGFLAAFLFNAIQAMDEQPDAPTTGQQADTDKYRKDLESWSDRGRWWNFFEDAGRTLIAAGLPLGLAALALSRSGGPTTPAEPPAPAAPTYAPPPEPTPKQKVRYP